MPQITLHTGPERRRRWSAAEQWEIMAAAFVPGAVVADVARREVGVTANGTRRADAKALRCSAACASDSMAAGRDALLARLP